MLLGQYTDGWVAITYATSTKWTKKMLLVDKKHDCHDPTKLREYLKRAVMANFQQMIIDKHMDVGDITEDKLFLPLGEAFHLETVNDLANAGRDLVF